MIKNTIVHMIKRSIIPVTLLIGVTACDSDNDPATVEPIAPVEIDPSTQVKLDYTSYGVPHITATNYQSLSYGQGYAHAQENMCTLAEQIINVRAKRAVTFGAGENDANINDDFGILALGVYQQAEESFAGLSDEHKSVINGYVQGFNKAVQEKGDASNYPSPCRDEGWIPEISSIDLHAFHLRLALLSSGDAVSSQVATAHPSQVAQGLANTINK